MLFPPFNWWHEQICSLHFYFTWERFFLIRYCSSYRLKIEYINGKKVVSHLSTSSSKTVQSQCDDDGNNKCRNYVKWTHKIQCHARVENPSGIWKMEPGMKEMKRDGWEPKEKEWNAIEKEGKIGENNEVLSENCWFDYVDKLLICSAQTLRRDSTKLSTNSYQFLCIFCCKCVYMQRELLKRHFILSTFDSKVWKKANEKCVTSCRHKIMES